MPQNPNSMHSSISIGMIGTDVVIHTMLQAVKHYPSFEPKIKIFERDEEAPELARQLMNDVEVMLFSGIAPFRLALKEIRFPFPVHYIPLTGTGLQRVLFRIYEKYGLSSLSVDSVTPKEMTETLQDLDKLQTHVVYYNHSVHPSPEELLSFHQCQVKQGHANAVLTANRQVAEALTELGIPNEWIVPTKQDIDISLSRAILSSESRRNKELQIVVGFIHVDKFSLMAQKTTSEHEVHRLKLDIHRLLLSYIESLEGHLTQIGSDEFFFITTRGTFEQQTRGYKFIPIAREAQKMFNLTLSIGIGFGKSANEAGTHARIALGHCVEGGGNICYIVREDKSLIGPIEMTEPLQHDTTLIDVKLMNTVRHAGLSGASLSKLISYFTRTGKTKFIAPELASILGLTTRSIHRNLATLLDAGLVTVVGEEKVRSRGRPNQVYHLAFIEQIGRDPSL
ncbi:MAG: hypothetical protein K0Q73_6838 [Paenibacillus sp.]|jgi:hypothetical protein|nr:hypothetical protein [Paenibacillus sp.]